MGKIVIMSFEGQNFGFKKKRYCTIRLAKTKVLISCAVTAQLICIFVFTQAKKQFSHDGAHLSNALSTGNLRQDLHRNSVVKITGCLDMAIVVGH